MEEAPENVEPALKISKHYNACISACVPSAAKASRLKTLNRAGSVFPADESCASLKQLLRIVSFQLEAVQLSKTCLSRLYGDMFHLMRCIYSSTS